MEECVEECKMLNLKDVTVKSCYPVTMEEGQMVNLLCNIFLKMCKAFWKTHGDSQ